MIEIWRKPIESRKKKKSRKTWNTIIVHLYIFLFRHFENVGNVAYYVKTIPEKTKKTQNNDEWKILKNKKYMRTRGKENKKNETC